MLQNTFRRITKNISVSIWSDIHKEILVLKNQLTKDTIFNKYLCVVVYRSVQVNKL